MRKGRKPTRRPDAGAALLAAASPDTAERLSPLSILRQRLAEYTALAETARLARDMAEYRIWSERSAQAARDLLPYEPPDPGSKVTRFPLAIFDSQRRPLNLELMAAPAPAPSVDEAKPADAAVEVLPPEPAKPAEESRPPEAPPSDTAGNGSEDHAVWARMQYWRTITNYGLSNRERLWTRRS